MSKTPLHRTTWSTNEHVLWSVSVPGRGHSSPIVRGDRVYLTTAIENARHGLKRTTQGITLLLLASVVLSGLIHHGGLRPRQGGPEHPLTLMRTVPWFIMMGCITGIALLGYHVVGSTAQDHEAGIVRWLCAAAILVACGATALYGLPGRSWWRCGSALVLVGLSAAVFLARPDPDYYHPFNGVQATQGVLLFAIALPAVMGLLLALGFLPRRLWQSGHPSRNVTAAVITNHGWPCLAANLAACGAGAALPVLIYQTTELREPVIDLLRAGNTAPLQYLGSAFAALTVALLVYAVVDILFAARQPLTMPTWLRVSVPLLGVGLAAAMNWVSVPSVERAIIAVDRRTGERVWMTKALRSPSDKLHQANTSASPTPTADEKAIYAYFGSAGAMAVDLNDGQLLWTQTDLPFVGIHGAGASPVLVKNWLVILSDMASAPYLTALDLGTGERVWTSLRQPWKGQHGCHCTPVVAKVDSRDLIIVWSWRTLTLYDASSGRELANVAVPGDLDGQRTANPIVDGERVYVFNMAQVCALDLRRMLDGQPPVVWTVDLRRRGPNTSSPVLHSGHLFMVSDLGQVTCVRSSDGRLLWQRSLRGRSAHFYASPVVVGDQLLIGDTQGRSHLLNADDRGQSVSVNDLGSPIYASPAPVDGQLFVRTTERLWCIGEDEMRLMRRGGIVQSVTRTSADDAERPSSSRILR